jgi:hypothetical protein
MRDYVHIRSTNTIWLHGMLGMSADPYKGSSKVYWLVARDIRSHCGEGIRGQP